MTLIKRKVLVAALIATVLLLANALIIACWLKAVVLIGWAQSFRAEYATGTAITVIAALLILLPSRQHPWDRWIRRCPVCDCLLLPSWLGAIQERDRKRGPMLDLAPPPAIRIPEIKVDDLRLRVMADEIMASYGSDGRLPGWPHLCWEELVALLEGTLSPARGGLDAEK